MVDQIREFSRVVNHVLLPLPGTYHIDRVHTFVGFRAQHLIGGRVRGRFETVAGSATIAEDPQASKERAVADLGHDLERHST